MLFGDSESVFPKPIISITYTENLVIIYLVMLVLVFVDKSYAQSIGQLETMEELIGLF